MEYIKFTLKGDMAFFKDPYKNDVELTYPQIHRPVLLGMVGAIMGFRGRESDMQYYTELHSLGVAIVPARLKFETHLESTVNTTGFANKGGFAQMIRRTMLVDPSWDIYLKQNDVSDNTWAEIKRRLIEKDFVYHIGLGRKHLFADIDNVEIGSMDVANTDEIDSVDSIMYMDDIVGDVDVNRLIYTSPIALYEINKKWEYVSEKLIFTNQMIDEFSEDVEIYDTGDVYLRFI